jgi:hypothetical protein
LELFKEAPKTLRALQQQEQGSWPVALALVEEVPAPTSKHTWGLVSAWLGDRGFEIQTDYLRAMRKTGEDFNDPASRNHRRPDGRLVPFRLYVAASQRRATPEQRQEWLAKAAAEGQGLRQFSEMVTGRKWADSTEERLAKAARETPEAIVEILQERPELVTRALRNAGVADAVVRDSDAHVAVIRASGRRAEERSVGRQPARQKDMPEPLARLLAMLNIEAVDRETRVMEQMFMEKFSGDFSWRPGEEEALLASLTASRARIDNAITLVEFKVPGTVS